MSRLAVLVGFLLVALGEAAMAQCGPGYSTRDRPKVKDAMLVNATWLAGHRRDSNLVVLHADRTPAVYDTAHVPGARLALLKEFVVDRDSLLTELPPVDHLVDFLRSRGVTDSSRVVIYGDVLVASRLWFTLDYLGMGDRAALLDGGLSAWLDAGNHADQSTPAAVKPGPLTARPRLDAVVDADWIRARLGDSSVALVDVRTPGEYRGEVEEAGVPRNGHLPGAVNLEWTGLLEDGLFKRPGSLRAMLWAVGASDGHQVVSVCRVGSRASLLYFVGRYLGFSTRMYDGSMNDWSRRGLPIVTGAAPR